MDAVGSNPLCQEEHICNVTHQINVWNIFHCCAVSVDCSPTILQHFRT